MCMRRLPRVGGNRRAPGRGRRLAGRGPAADLRRGPPAHRRGGQGLGSHHPARWPGLATGQRDRRARQADLRGAMRLVPRREGRGPKVQPRWSAGAARWLLTSRSGPIGSFWQYATTLWSYIRRAQPVRRPRLPHSRPGVRGDRLPPPPQWHHRRAGRHGREDPAAGQDAEPRRLRARPPARCGAGIATAEALGRSRGQGAKRIDLIWSLWLCWVERRQAFLYRDATETLIRTNKMVEDAASSEV